MSFGFAIAGATGSPEAANQLNIGLFTPVFLLAGIMYPLAGLSDAVRDIVIYAIPFAAPVQAIRGVVDGLPITEFLREARPRWCGSAARSSWPSAATASWSDPHEGHRGRRARQDAPGRGPLRLGLATTLRGRNACISETHSLRCHVAWDVYFTAVAEEWMLSLDDDDYIAMLAAIELLEEKGPALARPVPTASRVRAITTSQSPTTSTTGTSATSTTKTHALDASHPR